VTLRYPLVTDYAAKRQRRQSPTQYKRHLEAHFSTDQAKLENCEVDKYVDLYVKEEMVTAS
jgi:2-methylcitrate dehydratase